MIAQHGYLINDTQGKLIFDEDMQGGDEGIVYFRAMGKTFMIMYAFEYLPARRYPDIIVDGNYEYTASPTLETHSIGYMINEAARGYADDEVRRIDHIVDERIGMEVIAVTIRFNDTELISYVALIETGVVIFKKTGDEIFIVDNGTTVNDLMMALHHQVSFNHTYDPRKKPARYIEAYADVTILTTE